MDNRSNGRRSRKHRPLNGIPTAVSFAEGLTPQQREDRERVRQDWREKGRLALMSLSLAALAGCGGGSAETINAVGIGGTIPTHDSTGRPIAVQMTVVVTGNGVRPAGAK